MKKSIKNGLEKIVKVNAKTNGKDKEYYIFMYNNFELYSMVFAKNTNRFSKRVGIGEIGRIEKKVVERIIYIINNIYYDGIEDGIVKTITDALNICGPYSLDITNISLVSDFDNIGPVNYSIEDSKIIEIGISEKDLEKVRYYDSNNMYDIYKVYFLNMKTKKVEYDFYNASQCVLGLPNFTIINFTNDYILELNKRIRTNERNILLDNGKYYILHAIPYMFE